MQSQPEFVSAIANMPAGVHMMLTRDQRGDGYDIAVAPHIDDFSAIEAAVKARGGIAQKILAGGALCGYQISIPDAAEEQLRLCQHSGMWGPWYHVSAYIKRASGKWAFSHRVGGHYSAARAAALNLPYGRP